MARSIRSSLLTGLIALQLLFSTCTRHPESLLNPVEFNSPGDEFSVHTWWHWMDNAITRDGITKDLEAMKSQGITAATIFNIGLLNEADFGVPAIVFGSDQWFDKFRWALKEADRLGMKIGVHNCDGWSTSGGPWIKPENSMKQCIWSKTIIKGGIQKNLVPPPTGNMGFYKEIKILAFPVKSETTSFRKAKPEISINNLSVGNILSDGNPFSKIKVYDGMVISFDFKDDFKAKRIAIHPRLYFTWISSRELSFQCELKASTDGKTFRPVKLINTPEINKTSIYEMEQTSSRYYQLEFKNFNDIFKFKPYGLPDFSISEIELLGEAEEPSYNTEIPYHIEKTLGAKADSYGNLYTPGSDLPGAIAAENIIDVTQFLVGDSLLNWTAPQGNWAILRIGYTTTEVTNSPATIAGTGLECDKMDSSALNLHFRNFPQALVKTAGNYTGNTFEYLFVDSWESKFQNWTQKFPEEFEKRRGYSIIPWLPVICGETVGSADSTERFLYDFRLTIADLIEEHYYKHFASLCRQNKLKVHAEAIYGWGSDPPLDVLRTNSYFDVPMTEFWANESASDKLIHYSPSERAGFTMPAHASALYGKNVFAAEAYTGHATYSESPWDLKLFGDRIFCSGVNRMVLASYVHQPAERKPGMTLGHFGQAFNRHNPWWNFASQWFTYQRRVQYVLQKGITVADVLCFTGEKFINPDPATNKLYQLPPGINIQKCNLDILQNHCTVKDGKLILDNGISYSLLLLPGDNQMEISTLQLLSDLAEKGAVIVGPEPERTLGLLNSLKNNSTLKELANSMWKGADKLVSSSNSFGKGKIFAYQNLGEILKDMGIEPDFSCTGYDGPNLLFIHKKVGDDDVYFVVNQENKRVDRNCIFRISGKFPEIWDPLYGTVKVPGAYEEKFGLITIPVTFEPKEALFFVFKTGKNEKLAVRKEYIPVFSLENFNSSLVFEDLKDTAPINSDTLFSWSSSDNPSIKYYSGKAHYTISFDLPAETVNEDSLWLSPGEVNSPYEVTLNDNYLGCSTFPDFRFSVSGMLKESGNVLKLRVASTYRNRIIGDFKEFGELRNVWTTTSLEHLPDKKSQLQRSGLLGPVRLYSEK